MPRKYKKKDKQLTKRHEISVVRSGLGLTCIKFADVMRVTHACVLSWECHRRKPNEAHQAIIDRLGIILESGYMRRDPKHVETFVAKLLSITNMLDLLSFIFKVDVNMP